MTKVVTIPTRDAKSRSNPESPSDSQAPNFTDEDELKAIAQATGVHLHQRTCYDANGVFICDHKDGNHLSPEAVLHRDTLDHLEAKATAEIGSEKTTKKQKKKEAAVLSKEEAAATVAKSGADFLHLYEDGDLWYSYNRVRFVVMRMDYRNARELQEQIKAQLDKWDAEHPDKKVSTRKTGKA